MDYTYNPVTQREVFGNENFQAPMLTKENVIHPKHSKQQVIGSLQAGHKVLVDYSPALKEVTIEAIGPKKANENLSQNQKLELAAD